MTASQCRQVTEPSATRRTCIESLAEGWINPPDLCGSCTAVFMAALDGIAGPLEWHPAYVDRAAEVSR